MFVPLKLESLQMMVFHYPEQKKKDFAVLEEPEAFVATSEKKESAFCFACTFQIKTFFCSSWVTCKKLRKEELETFFVVQILLLSWDLHHTFCKQLEYLFIALELQAKLEWIIHISILFSFSGLFFCVVFMFFMQISFKNSKSE